MTRLILTLAHAETGILFTVKARTVNRIDLRYGLYYCAGDCRQNAAVTH